MVKGSWRTPRKLIQIQGEHVKHHTYSTERSGATPLLGYLIINNYNRHKMLALETIHQKKEKKKNAKLGKDQTKKMTVPKLHV